MVYSNKFVACVLVNGTPCTERHDGVVAIPFGTEYSLRFRNKHNRRAVVKFTIDGENVSGNGYVIPANDAIDIHRHAHKDVRFKFVNLDSPEAVEFGKNGPNDGTKGVIEAKFYLEKSYYQPTSTVVHHHHYDYKPWITWPPINVPPSPSYPAYPTWCGTTPNSLNYVQCSAGGGGTKCCSAGTPPIPPTIQFNMPPNVPVNFGTPLQDGCTVEGSQSYQTFNTVYLETESDYVTLKLVLKGITGHACTERHCTACGAKRSRKTDNFCGICGHKF